MDALILTVIALDGKQSLSCRSESHTFLRMNLKSMIHAHHLMKHDGMEVSVVHRFKNTVSESIFYLEEGR